MKNDRDNALSMLWGWIGGESSKELRQISEVDISLLDVSFFELSDEAKLLVYVGYRYAMAMADVLSVWQLGCLLDGFSLADDAFKDFRRALILQGRYIFNQAVTVPDDLAESIIDSSAVPELSVGTMGLLDDFGAQLNLDLKIPPSNERWSSAEAGRNRISKKLPKLWKLVGNKYRFDYDPPAANRVKGKVFECNINGLGVVRVGEKIRRKSNGKIFVVLAIEDPIKGVLRVDKGDGIVGSLLVLSELYDVV